VAYNGILFGTTRFMGLLALEGHSSLKQSVNSEIPRLEEAIKNLHRVKPHKSESKKPFWESIFVSATHCGGGCTLGDVGSAWLVFFANLTLFGLLWQPHMYLISHSPGFWGLFSNT
jgi:hypothetical protein